MSGNLKSAGKFVSFDDDASAERIDAGYAPYLILVQACSSPQTIVKDCYRFLHILSVDPKSKGGDLADVAVSRCLSQKVGVSVWTGPI